MQTAIQKCSIIVGNQNGNQSVYLYVNIIMAKKCMNNITKVILGENHIKKIKKQINQ